MPPPRRGRPPASSEVRDALRRQILEGAARAYGRLGWHAVTIDEIVAEAGISRPTYYRVFRDKHEAVEAVIKQVNASLLAVLARAIAMPGDAEERARAAIEAYFDWGLAAGAVARMIYRELQLPSGPAQGERLRTLAQISRLLHQAGRRGARQRLMDTAALHAIEHLGSRLFEQAGEVLREDALHCALQLVRCALQERAEPIAHAPAKARRRA